MKNWCKIIKLKTYDVLVLRVTDSDGDEAIELKAKIEVDECIVIPTATLGFGDDSDKADKAFESYSKEEAELFVSDMVEMLS